MYLLSSCLSILHHARLAGGAEAPLCCLFVCPSVRSFVRCQNCEHDILKTNEHRHEKINSMTQEVKGQDHTRSQIDLERGMDTLPRVNPLTGTGNHSATSNNVKLVHWLLMGGLLHLVQRGGDWAGPQPAQAPSRCTKCNSPPINGQCTNHRIAV